MVRVASHVPPGVQIHHVKASDPPSDHHILALADQAPLIDLSLVTILVEDRADLRVGRASPITKALVQMRCLGRPLVLMNCRALSTIKKNKYSKASRDQLTLILVEQPCTTKIRVVRIQMSSQGLLSIVQVPEVKTRPYLMRRMMMTVLKESLLSRCSEAQVKTVRF